MNLQDDNIIEFPSQLAEAFRTKPSVPARIVGPIETEMRETLSKLRGSRYPDSFDWSVYDQIAAKFDEPPRGSVVFNTTFKLVNHHSTCTKCLYSFEIDSYGRGCFHNCAYCYAKDLLEKRAFWNRPQPFPVNLASVRKTFHTVFETDKPSKWREIMAQRTPLRIGSMSDSFMWLDTKYGVTKELLKILDFYKYPHVIFTRSDLIAHEDYISLLNKDLCAVQFSIVGNSHRLTRIIEPGAPSYRRRLIALSKLADAGIWTTVRINPLFPKYPDGYFTDPESIKERFGSRANVPVLDLYDDNFIGELAEAKVPSVLAGFVRLSGHTVNTMSKVTGIDVRSFFRTDFLAKRGDNRYSDAEIAQYYKMFQKDCIKHKVRFSTCYIGNGMKDFFQYQDMWSNKAKDCCDVVGNLPSFKSSAQSIPWETRLKHAPCKADALKTQAQDVAITEEFERTGAVTVPSQIRSDLHV
jgi:DNA repair photolyase